MKQASDSEEEEENDNDAEAEAETVEEYLRFHQEAGSWLFEVARVEWLHPHEPRLIWTPFRTWTEEPSAEQRLAARTAAIEGYFRTCLSCNELCNIGHMHDQQICQGCAASYLGVVY